MKIEKTNQIFPKIFLWMFIGLAVTFGVGYFVSTNENMLYNIFSKNIYIILIIIEIVVVIAISYFINKIPPIVAKGLFILYSALTGLTFSTIFVAYSMQSILYVFALTSALFLIFAAIGYFTKVDITKIGSFLLMLLFGIIILTVINIFVGSDGLNFGLCILGLIVFIAYIAYDIQVIKRNMYSIEHEDNLAIYGALQLYLDFINIFIRLLSLFGKSDN